MKLTDEERRIYNEGPSGPLPPRWRTPAIWVGLTCALYLAACCTPALYVGQGFHGTRHGTMYGAQCLLFYMVLPMWLANPLAMVGVVALAYRRVALAAAFAGIAFTCALSLLIFAGVKDLHVGAWLWLASLAVLVVGSFATASRRSDS